MPLKQEILCCSYIYCYVVSYMIVMQPNVRCCPKISKVMSVPPFHPYVRDKWFKWYMYCLPPFTKYHHRLSTLNYSYIRKSKNVQIKDLQIIWSFSEYAEGRERGGRNVSHDFGKRFNLILIISGYSLGKGKKILIYKLCPRLLVARHLNYPASSFLFIHAHKVMYS